ncbi:hypothetical protein OVA24_18650 [Luteolibacter sp. SL250]|uniref:hypothetical protein n=1 Tax=Luteolibacter sp. SL250 TaxID=2995170 RepID=UPI002271F4ED|nr:hypothetical protein [Luteolibacter sp. SL250]WAC19249.1 hypothetical protein OVA24_18650 [Luteolibacter sp. SL250]
MPETEISTVVILIAACAGILFLILIGVMVMGSRLARIERLLAVQSENSREQATQRRTGEVIETRSGTAFDKFLDEEPSRKLLSKKEQSAAYRKWRQEQGMNWSNS